MTKNKMTKDELIHTLLQSLSDMADMVAKEDPKEALDEVSPAPKFEYTPNRQCGGCTMCCEGWLTGDVHGKFMHSGNPCHYKNETQCTIYDQRPKMCSDFKCMWLEDGDVPEWLKPSIAKVIMYNRHINDIPYVSVVECGKPIDSVVLNWIVQHALSKSVNLRYMVSGGWYMIGSTEFIEEMNK